MAKRDEIEKTRCRGPFAALVNHTPGHFWWPNPNLQWMLWGAKKGGQNMGLAEESGKPDGLVFKPRSQVACVECKAFEGSLVFAEFRQNQRDWYYNTVMAHGTDTQYWLAIHITIDREFARLNNKRAFFYLVPFEEFLYLESVARSKDAMSIAACEEAERQKAFKDFTLDKYWSRFQLRFESGAWGWGDHEFPKLMTPSHYHYVDHIDRPIQTPEKRSEPG